jgi:hypothetical protein
MVCRNRVATRGPICKSERRCDHEFTPEGEGIPNGAFDEGTEIRNPFGVMDVPHPNDQEAAAWCAASSICCRCTPLHGQDHDNTFTLLHPEKNSPRANPSAKLAALSL